MIVRVTQIVVVISYCLFAILPLPVVAETSSYDEYALKTAFLYRSLHYIEWLADPADEKTNQISICITSDDDFSTTLKSLHQQKIDLSTIVVKTFEHYEDMRDCHVVYVTKHAADRAIELFSDTNVLTVGDYPGFIEAGGILNFPLRKNKVSLEINHNEAIQHNLKISAKLLRIAKVKNKPAKSP